MDKGKRWKCTLKNGEILYSDNKYDFYDSYYNLGKNVAHLEEFIEKSICPNCEQLQKSFDEAVEVIKFYSKQNDPYECGNKAKEFLRSLDKDKK